MLNTFLCVKWWLASHVRVPSMHAILRIPEGNINNVASNQIYRSPEFSVSVFSVLWLFLPHEVEKSHINLWNFNFDLKNPLGLILTLPCRSRLYERNRFPPGFWWTFHGSDMQQWNLRSAVSVWWNIVSVLLCSEVKYFFLNLMHKGK